MRTRTVERAKAHKSFGSNVLNYHVPEQKPLRGKTPQYWNPSRSLCWSRVVILRGAEVLTLAVAVSLAALAGFGAEIAFAAESLSLGIVSMSFGLAVAVLLAGVFVFVHARARHWTQLKNHKPAAADEQLKLFQSAAFQPQVSFLICVDGWTRHAVRRSAMSALLQDYPNRSLVFLHGSGREGAPNPLWKESIERLGDELQDFVRPLKDLCESASQELRDRLSRKDLESPVEFLRASQLFFDIARWLDQLAESWDMQDDLDALFASGFLKPRAEQYREKGHILFLKGVKKEQGDWQKELTEELERLRHSFSCPISCFDRSQYENVPHGEGKVAAYSSYLGLMGLKLKSEAFNDRLLLETCKLGEIEHADLSFPSADFVVFLDPGTLLRPGYVLNLVALMKRPEHKKTGAMPTPLGVLLRPRSFWGQLTQLFKAPWQWGSNSMTLETAAAWTDPTLMVRRKALQDLANFHDERGYCMAQFLPDARMHLGRAFQKGLQERGWNTRVIPHVLSDRLNAPSV